MRPVEATPAPRRRGMLPRAVPWLFPAIALLLAGCAGSAYFVQSFSGQYDLLRRARPLDEVMADPRTGPELRGALATAAAIRDFAARELLLPDNASYRRFADIGRPFVVWNVFAAPELSVKLREWCFPVAGCVGYRGYFDQNDADGYAARLRREDLDVYVVGIPAYSTLGWFDDPLLSTFILYPEAELARLLFHELAHQVAYVRDDSTFNESFAVAVERAGVRRYLARVAPERLPEFERANARREDFGALVEGARARLAGIYAAPLDDASKRDAKRRAIAALRRDYESLKRERWNGYAGYDGWFAGEINNAKLASMALYTQRVPAFEALLAGGDLGRFYARVRELAAMSRAERERSLDAAGGAQAASE